MKFTVIWKTAAENQLAQIWTDSDRRDAVTDAAREVDSLLKNDPQDHGESRQRMNQRIVYHALLGVVFEVNRDDRIVNVLAV